MHKPPSSKRGSGRPPAGAASARDALLRAGASHFSAYGYDGANTRAILADAGTTAPALYHHFGNKTGLYIAAASAAQEHVLETFTVATTDRDAGIDRVSALLMATVSLRREHPHVARYLTVIQQDVERHPELAELTAYEARFDEFWQRAANAESQPGRAVALRALIEGVLAVGGANLGLDDVSAGAAVLEAVLASGLASWER